MLDSYNSYSVDTKNHIVKTRDVKGKGQREKYQEYCRVLMPIEQIAMVHINGQFNNIRKIKSKPRCNSSTVEHQSDAYRLIKMKNI